jgi:methylase of polypeptide subunit release factors
MPILIEAKSAGDATNTNKRRKEEAQKYSQLKERYGQDIHYILLLCGYFKPTYLGYEASEGIDWVWEHRLDDLDQLLDGKIKKKARSVTEETVQFETNVDGGEIKRFTLQKQIDDSKSPEERNKRGQFSTPHPLALEIIMSALNHLPKQVPVSFIEPGMGTGVFFSALRHLAIDRTIREAVGVEKDPAYAEVASKIWSPHGLAVELKNFLDFAADPKQSRRYNLLCTNPPYVRHHHLDPKTKQRLQVLISNQLGITASGLSGLYVYFMLLSHEILADDAIAAWLVPSEFLYVNYGKAVRDYLLRHVTLLSIHQFDPEEVKFDDALVSSCIVIYRKRPPAPGTTFRFSFGADLLETKHVHEIAIENQVLSGKWTSLHFGDEERADGNDYKIADFFTIKRGLATGANEFFIVDKEIIEQYEIPSQFVKPILPGPRYLTETVIEAERDGTPKIERVKYLIDCDVPPNIVKKNYPSLWRYFQTGVEKGIPERYLCASRAEWYYQERRAPSPFLATYIGRSQNGTKSPFRFILNLSRALVTNVYLNLYPNETLASLLQEDRARRFELVKLLNQIPLDEIMRAGRSYGGGLHKIEPRELADVTISQLPTWLKKGIEKQLVML